jgi:hypothetical protein
VHYVKSSTQGAALVYGHIGQDFTVWMDSPLTAVAWATKRD